MNLPEPKIPFLDHKAAYAHPPLDRIIDDERAWTLDTVNPGDMIIYLDEIQQKELGEIIKDLADNPYPELMRTPDHVIAPHVTKAMHKIRILLASSGFGVIDRLPMDDIDKDTARSLYWILGQMVSRPVAQKWDGTMIYDVLDVRKDGYGRTKGSYTVRGSLTNAELLFHTDNGFNVTLPDAVSLLCLNQAKEGGLNRFASIYTLHNRMLERCPGHLKRLYQPALFNRHKEHVEGEPIILRAPIFSWDNERLTARPNPVYVRQAYEMAGLELDSALEDALDALVEVAKDADLWIEMRMERGQIQFINNRQILHYRSSYVDFDEPELQRHMIRLWYRDTGRPMYSG